MTNVLSHEAFHRSVGLSFDEMLVMEQLSRLSAESILRVLQSIPEPLLQHAAAGLAATPPSAPRAPAERRGSSRRQVLRGARLSGDGRTILEVQVRGISEGGCRIWTRAPSDVPDYFTIRIVGFEGERPCEVRWRSGNELGVQYLDR
jgi:hypothetical protein